MSPPLIGITLDTEPPGGYSRFPWLALRQNYAKAVSQAGGLPVLLPPHPEHAGAFLDRLAGVIISGGNFDVDPALFGAGTRHPSVRTNDERTAFEALLIEGALQRDLPLLGICGGEQLLNVVLGGSLIQHIPDEVANALAHEQVAPRDQPGHSVRLVVGTRLHAIAGADELEVNSSHHQAVRDVPTGVVVNAIAPDGVIEGIEAPERRFCLGVQWHPEFGLSDADRRLFAAFVGAAQA